MGQRGNPETNPVLLLTFQFTMRSVSRISTFEKNLIQSKCQELFTRLGSTTRLFRRPLEGDFAGVGRQFTGGTGCLVNPKPDQAADKN